MNFRHSFLSLVFAGFIGSAFAEVKCPYPNADTMKAFELIEASNVKELKKHLTEFTLQKDVFSPKCETMYFTALKVKNEEIRKLLELKNLGPTNAEEINKPVSYYTAYEYALRFGSLMAIKDLRQRGGILNDQHFYGYTELHHTAGSNTIDTVKFFIDAGLDVNALTRSKATVLEYAISNNEPGLVKLLLDHGARLELSSAWAQHSAAHSSLADVKLLMGEGLDFKTDKVFEAAAFVNNDVAVIKFLLSLGLEVNRPQGVLSPLMYAAWGNTKEVVKVLLDAGADKRAVDHRQMQASDFASRYRTINKDRREILELLK